MIKRSNIDKESDKIDAFFVAGNKQLTLGDKY